MDTVRYLDSVLNLLAHRSDVILRGGFSIQNTRRTPCSSDYPSRWRYVLVALVWTPLVPTDLKYEILHLREMNETLDFIPASKL